MLERVVVFTGVLWESWWDCKCSTCSWNSGGGGVCVYVCVCVCVRVCGPLSDEHRQNTEHRPSWVRPVNKRWNNVCTGGMHAQIPILLSSRCRWLNSVFPFTSLSYCKARSLNSLISNSRFPHVIIMPKLTWFKSSVRLLQFSCQGQVQIVLLFNCSLTLKSPSWRRSPPPEEILPSVPVRLMAS